MHPSAWLTEVCSAAFGMILPATSRICSRTSGVRRLPGIHPDPTDAPRARVSSTAPVALRPSTALRPGIALDCRRIVGSAEAIYEWNAAVEEYFEWQAMAGEALRSGAHPAIAYAIGRTGKLTSENVELTPDSTHAIASGEDADWLEAFNEYAKKHPETVASEFLRGRGPGRERLH